MRAVVVAAAALAACQAQAQSSLTLFGVVDNALTLGYGQGAGSSDRRQMTHSALAASRLGFRGTEDLGGGMNASFWLEAGVATDSGIGAATNSNNQTSGAGTAAGLTFNRRSTVSLGGPWGELRLGRDFTPYFRNLTVFDPFETNGVGAALTLNGATSTATGGASLNIVGPTAVRASNSISYFLPANAGGFYGQVQYFLGENASGAANEKDGTGGAWRLGWTQGPINVAASWGRVDYARTATAGDVTTYNVGGSYDIGQLRLMGHIGRDKVETNTGVRARGFLVGAHYKLGAGEFKAAYSGYRVSQLGADPDARKLALGYVHNLSKRTAVYATVARVNNKDGANHSLGGAIVTPNNSSSGVDIGLRHIF